MISYLRLAAAYFRLNLSAHWEYRTSFISQVVAMVLNDAAWLAFWLLFFDRFLVLRGWTRADVITMWAVAASAFGLVTALCGNTLLLPSLIVNGQLDAWMLYPRRLLPHLLIGRMSASGWGDFLFGGMAYLLLVQPSVGQALLFALLVISASALILGFGLISGSLAFYLRQAVQLSEQWRFALITFSTYPSVLFEGATRLLLYTLIPAAFVSYLPVDALRDLDLATAAAAIAGALTCLALGVAIFYAGLRRYESGNLMQMRG